MSVPKIRYLTPFRGIAALLVVVFHSMQRLPTLNSFLWSKTALFGRGYLWVDFFFILSGFIMMHVYGKRFREQIASGTFGKFVAARFARIYPLHFFVLCLYVLFILILSIIDGNLAWFEKETFAPTSLLSNLLLIHGLGVHSKLTWNMPSWSISAEWAVYFLFPILGKGFSSRWGRWLQLGFAVVGLFFLDRRFQNLNLAHDYGFVRCLFEFILGICIYDLFYKKWERHVTKSQWPMIAGITFTLFLFHFPRETISDYWLVISFGVLILLLSLHQGHDYTFLNSQPMELLGDISYSIYMTHFFLLTVIIKVFDSMGIVLFDAQISLGLSLLALVIFIGLVLLASFATYRLVEIPGKRRVKRVLTKSKRERAAAG